MKCWFWNIDRNNRKYFRDQLELGWLRQGWSYDKDLDLRKLKTKIKKNEALSENEKIAWDRCHYMLQSISEGDLVIVKNIPDNNTFSLVRVTGKYDFMEEIGDFAHRLRIEIIGKFHKRSKLVPVSLVKALDREQNPIRITLKHHQTVIGLLSAAKQIEATKSLTLKNRLEELRLSLIEPLKKSIKNNITHRDAEKLIFEILKYDGLEVVKTAGSNERGADFVSTIQLGYGLDTKIAIQVKMHWGTDNDTEGLGQIKTAFREHKVDAAILVSFADKLGKKLERELAELRKAFKIEVLYGEDLYSKILEIVTSSGYELGLD